MYHMDDCCSSVLEILIQHIAIKVPDRAEFRQKASAAIVELTSKIPEESYSRILMWFFRLAHSERIAHRQFTVEVIGKLLTSRKRGTVNCENIASINGGEAEG